MTDILGWLDVSDAARYLRITESRFGQLVRSGKLPRPSRSLGPQSPRWHVVELDAAMGKGSLENGLKEKADAIRAQIRAQGSHRQKAAG